MKKCWGFLWLICSLLWVGCAFGQEAALQEKWMCDGVFRTDAGYFGYEVIDPPSGGSSFSYIVGFEPHQAGRRLEKLEIPSHFEGHPLTKITDFGRCDAAFLYLPASVRTIETNARKWMDNVFDQVFFYGGEPQLLVYQFSLGEMKDTRGERWFNALFSLKKEAVDFTYVLTEDGTARITGVYLEDYRTETLMIPGELDGHPVSGIDSFDPEHELMWIDEMILPASLVEISQEAIRQMRLCVISFQVETGNPAFASREGCLTSRNGSRLILSRQVRHPAAASPIPESVTVLGPDSVNVDGLFANFCLVPDSVIQVEDNAFEECCVVLARGGSPVAQWAEKSGQPFYPVEEIVTYQVDLQGRMHSPRQGLQPADEDAAGIVALHEPSQTVALSQLYSNDCDTLVLNPGIRALGPYCFFRLNSCDEVIMPEELETIGYRAFEYSDILRAVVPDTVTRLEAAAFENAWLLQELILPPHLTTAAPAAQTYRPEVTPTPSPTQAPTQAPTPAATLIPPAACDHEGERTYNAQHPHQEEYCAACGLPMGYFSEDSRRKNPVFVEGCPDCLAPQRVYGPVDLPEADLADFTIRYVPNMAEYTIQGELGIYLMRYTGEKKELAVPDRAWIDSWQEEGLVEETVTVIADNAFAHTGVTRLYLPDTIHYIGSRAFAQCPELTEVMIDNRYVTLSPSAFEGVNRQTVIYGYAGTTVHAAARAAGLTFMDIVQGEVAPQEFTQDEMLLLTANCTAALPGQQAAFTLSRRDGLDLYGYGIDIYVNGSYLRTELLKGSSHTFYLTVEEPLTVSAAMVQAPEKLSNSVQVSLLPAMTLACRAPYYRPQEDRLYLSSGSQTLISIEIEGELWAPAEVEGELRLIGGEADWQLQSSIFTAGQRGNGEIGLYVNGELVDTLAVSVLTLAVEEKDWAKLFTLGLTGEVSNILTLDQMLAFDWKDYCLPLSNTLGMTNFKASEKRNGWELSFDVYNASPLVLGIAAYDSQGQMQSLHSVDACWQDISLWGTAVETWQGFISAFDGIVGNSEFLQSKTAISVFVPEGGHLGVVLPSQNKNILGRCLMTAFFEILSANESSGKLVEGMADSGKLLREILRNKNLIDPEKMSQATVKMLEDTALQQTLLNSAASTENFFEEVITAILKDSHMLYIAYDCLPEETQLKIAMTMGGIGAEISENIALLALDVNTYLVKNGANALVGYAQAYSFVTQLQRCMQHTFPMYVRNVLVPNQ